MNLSYVIRRLLPRFMRPTPRSITNAALRSTVQNEVPAKAAPTPAPENMPSENKVDSPQ